MPLQREFLILVNHIINPLDDTCDFFMQILTHAQVSFADYTTSVGTMTDGISVFAMDLTVLALNMVRFY